MSWRTKKKRSLGKSAKQKLNFSDTILISLVFRGLRKKEHSEWTFLTVYIYSIKKLHQVHFHTIKN